VIAAAKAVSAHEFIMKFEKGYDTDVNERGTRLSAGQRQLIAFARTLLANPRILILDEATSSIDTHTEKLVQQGIHNLLCGRTSFVIAHRLSTIRNADRIMVVEDGGIVESGTHEELISLEGRYYNFYIAQFKFLNKMEVEV
ncbi:MAG: ATP-binding cassette domain-containing protein, partial [Clostridiaceae bacterium]|nr:ATP-binding cassette domain-containing protein [Clostridiaceae bacterium]